MPGGLAIEFRNVHKRFDDSREVLAGMSLAVRPSEVMFIIGTSGVGKSVTIKHLIGLLRPDAGEIWVGDQRVDGLSEKAFIPVRKRCAMVFQAATLFDSMTLTENVMLPIRTHRRLGADEAAQAARELLTRVGVAEFADRVPPELGQGVRKRAAIARALALEPECILFDEPTTGLDPISARQVDRLIRELTDRHGMTAIVVSHDLTSTFAIADRVALLYRGVVHALGAPSELRASSDPVVQQFLAGRPDGPMDTPGF